MKWAEHHTLQNAFYVRFYVSLSHDAEASLSEWQFLTCPRSLQMWDNDDKKEILAQTVNSLLHTYNQLKYTTFNKQMAISLSTICFH